MGQKWTLFAQKCIYLPVSGGFGYKKKQYLYINIQGSIVFLGVLPFWPFLNHCGAEVLSIEAPCLGPKPKGPMRQWAKTPQPLTYALFHENPEVVEMVLFLDPETIGNLDPEIMKMDQKVSGFRKCRNGVTSGSRNCKNG